MNQEIRESGYRERSGQARPRISVRIDQPLLDKLEEIVSRTGMTLSAVVASIISKSL